jgi:shikimate dehydrogenase
MTLPDRYAVIGNPVAHSQSPWIHAEFARQTGQAVDYGRIDCPGDAFEATVTSFARSGNADAGLGPARGCNITIPFKTQVIPLASQVSSRARLAEAANTLRFDEAGWFADNTDGVGLVRDLADNAGIALRGSRILLIGAGGAACGVLGPLIEARPSAIQVVNRTASKARDLVARHRALAEALAVELRAGELADSGSGYSVVLNTSASSLAGAAIPVPARVLAPGGWAVDLMYGAAAQPFIVWAQAHGANGRDGLGMLVEQAAEAFFVWRGVRPATEPVLAALRLRLSQG